MAVTKVVMPKLSEQMEAGKIIKWLKQEGDRIQSGDILAEVETDKADVEMEAFGSGVLRKILVPAGNQAPVGSLIGVIAEPSEDISQLGGPDMAPQTPQSAQPAKPSAPATAGVGATEMAPQTPQSAQPAKPSAPAAVRAGATEMANRPAVVPPMPRREDHAARTPSPASGPEAPPPSTRTAPGAPARPSAPAEPMPTAASLGGGRVKASPLARKIAAQSGVDLKLLQGSGPGGRVVRRDVEAASVGGGGGAQPAVMPAVAPGVEFEDRPLTPMRAAIAKRMPLSKAPVPHFYVTSEIAMDRAWSLREELNALEGQPKISVNDFVIRACAVALLHHPGVNASFQGESIRVFHRAHVGIAVALDDGLITPVLRDAHTKGLAQIAVEARDLAERARHRKLRAPEMTGATFSISNLGMLDVTEFSAIINPPEGAILAVGSVRTVPVVRAEDGLGVGRRMMLTLSCDHRVMDGAMGARFLQDVKRLLEEPLRLLV